MEVEGKYLHVLILIIPTEQSFSPPCEYGDASSLVAERRGHKCGAHQPLLFLSRTVFPSFDITL